VTLRVDTHLKRYTERNNTDIKKYKNGVFYKID